MFPLMNEKKTEEVSQILMFDDLSSSGEPKKLKAWIEKIKNCRQRYGNNLKKGKSFVLAKTATC